MSNKKNKKKIDKNVLITPDFAANIAVVRDRTYPSDGLTPAKLAAALKEANKGNVSAQAEMFTEMEEKDWDLGAALSTRRNAVLGLNYSIIAADDSPLGIKAAEACKVLCDEYIENFRDALGYILTSIGQGFSVCELNWEYRDNFLWVTDIIPIEHRYFTFFYDNKIQRQPRLLTVKEPKYGEELIPYKYIVHKHTAASGMPTRDGLVRLCAYLYLFKNYSIKDWVSFLDSYGIPMKIGKYTNGASPESVNVLRRAIMSLGSDAAALLSDATNIEIKGVDSRPSDMFERSSEYFGRKIDKVILGHSGATESTPGKLGNNQESVDVRQDLLEKDTRQLEHTLQQQLLYPFVLLNFGESCPVPKISFDSALAEDTKSLSEVISTLVNAGFTNIPLSYLHDKFSIPQPQENELTLKDLIPQFSGLSLSNSSKRFPLNNSGALPSLTGKLPDLIPADAVSNAFDTEMLRLIDIIKSCNTFAEAEEQIRLSFPMWRDDELTQKITQGLYISSLAGMADDYTNPSKTQGR